MRIAAAILGSCLASPMLAACAARARTHSQSIGVLPASVCPDADFGVPFEAGAAALNLEGIEIVDAALARVPSCDPGKVIFVVAGFADQETLAEKRAAAVREKLVERASRIRPFV